jgi:glycerol-3-phosphate dehydrogenase
MKRILERLANEPFDVLVVGGGIHGAAVIKEASARGYKAALIDQGDFGQATSANSLKIIHGGLRYLQQGDFKRMRQSIKARRAFMQSAPHLVRPQPFLLPLYGHGLRGREAMTAGLILNDLVSWDRNQSLSPENRIPSGQILSARDCLKLFPDLEKQGLTGGAVWYDALAVNTERLTLDFILAASEKGAVVANYVKALSLVINNGSIKGVEAQDRITKDRFRINSPWVINATGPWLNTLVKNEYPTGPLPIRWTRGINLIINRPFFSKYGLGLGGNPLKNKNNKTGKKQRLFFFVPWKGCTMVGTDYRRYDGEPGPIRPEVEDIQNFIYELNTLYPNGNLTLKDVSFFHCGLLPISEGQDPADYLAEPDRHFRLFDHDSPTRIKGLVSIKSTKYTTAPVVAEKVIDFLGQKENNPPSRKATDGESPSYHFSSLVRDLAEAKPGDSPEYRESIAGHLHESFGTRAHTIITVIRRDPAMGYPVSNDPPILAAEIIHGVREEMALKLSDVVFRRTDLGQARRPSLEILQNVSRIMGQELGWNEEGIKKEIQEVLAVYSPLNSIDPPPPI